MDASDVFSKASKSIVYIITYDSKQTPISFGSGVVIAKNKVITNCHVLEEAIYVQIKYDNNFYYAELSNHDVKHDLCILKIDYLNAPIVSLRNSDTLRIGEKVYTIGAPLGLELNLADGLISSLRQSENANLIITNAPISPGSSGGGLFDSDANLIGITTLYLEGGQNLNIAIPVEWIKRLADMESEKENLRQEEEHRQIAEFNKQKQLIEQQRLADKDAKRKAEAERVALEEEQKILAEQQRLADEEARRKIEEDRHATEKAQMKQEEQRHAKEEAQHKAIEEQQQRIIDEERRREETARLALLEQQSQEAIANLDRLESETVDDNKFCEEVLGWWSWKGWKTTAFVLREGGKIDLYIQDQRSLLPVAKIIPSEVYTAPCDKTTLAVTALLGVPYCPFGINGMPERKWNCSDPKKRTILLNFAGDEYGELVLKDISATLSEDGQCLRAQGAFEGEGCFRREDFVPTDKPKSFQNVMGQ
jgi:Trypsin-like serine proteases, typically periplasmic, contain C-terminal PDZ domain